MNETFYYFLTQGEGLKETSILEGFRFKIQKSQKIEIKSVIYPRVKVKETNKSKMYKQRIEFRTHPMKLRLSTQIKTKYSEYCEESAYIYYCYVTNLKQAQKSYKNDISLLKTLHKFGNRSL